MALEPTLLCECVFDGDDVVQQSLLDGFQAVCKSVCVYCVIDTQFKNTAVESSP